MELRKIKKRITAAYNYSFIRMTLNFYTCYEMMAEKIGVLIFKQSDHGSTSVLITMLP